MTTLHAAPQSAATAAERNWLANRPHVPALADVALPEVEWVYGRDGSLTARVDSVATHTPWLGGSGLPARVAEVVMASADVSRGSLCLIAPNHTQHVARLLRRLPSGGSLLVAWPSLEEAALAMRCIDFSEDFETDRLHMIVGDSGFSRRAGPAAPQSTDTIAEQIAHLVETRRGWAVPTTLFQAGDSEAVHGDSAKRLLEACRDALQQAGAERGRQLKAAASVPPSEDGPTVLVAGSAFSLWTDAGPALARVMGDANVRRIDPDDARTASPLAVAEAARGASRLITADLVRADLPSVVHAELPWVTWISRERTPVPYRGGRDVIVLADERWWTAWRDAGWPAERMRLGGWPAWGRDVEASGSGSTPVARPLQRPGMHPSTTTLPPAEASSPTAQHGAGKNAPLLLAYDLPEPGIPKELSGYSSWKVLWEQIEHELSHRPFTLHGAGGMRPYLLSRAEGAGVTLPPETIKRWTSACLVPSFVRGIAKLLERCDLPVRIAGRGWDGWEETDRWVGEVESEADLVRLLVGCRAVVDPTPGGLAAIESVSAAGWSTVRACDGADSFLRQAKRPAVHTAIVGVCDAIRSLPDGI